MSPPQPPSPHALATELFNGRRDFPLEALPTELRAFAQSTAQRFSISYCVPATRMFIRCGKDDWPSSSAGNRVRGSSGRQQLLPCRCGSNRELPVGPWFSLRADAATSGTTPRRR